MTKRSAISLLVGAVALLFAGPSASSDVYTLTGTISKEKVDQLLQDAPTEILLTNSFGGSLPAMARAAEYIRKNNIKTTLKGKCFSACTFIFLAGVDRKIVGDGEAMMLLHAPYREVGSGFQKDDQYTESFRDLVKKLSNNKISVNVMQIVMSSAAPGAGLLIRQADRKSGFDFYHCDGSENGKISLCKKLKDLNPYELGFLP